MTKINNLKTTSNHIMKVTIVLIFLVLVACHQVTEARFSDDIKNFIKNDILGDGNTPVAEIKPSDDPHGAKRYVLKTVIGDIKDSARSSWKFIKEMADNAQKEIKKWMQSVKVYANDVKSGFQQQLSSLEEKVNNIIKNIYGSGNVIQQCIEKQRPKLQELLKEITKQMMSCIMNELRKLTLVNGRRAGLSINDTEYLNNLNNQFEACQQDPNNVSPNLLEDCMQTVRKSAFEDVQEKQAEIMRTTAQARGLVDNVKSSVMSCSLDNLANASYLISNEIMEAVKCFIENSGNSTLVGENKEEGNEIGANTSDEDKNNENGANKPNEENKSDEKISNNSQEGKSVENVINLTEPVPNANLKA